MKQRFLTILVSSFLLVCCDSNIDSDRKKAFNSFVSQLPEVALPFNYNSDSQINEVPFKNRIDELIFPNSPFSNQVIGYFKSDSKTIHVIRIVTGDFFQALTISTFDKNGKELNSISPSIDDCVGAIPIGFSDCQEIITIKKDKTIEVFYRKIINRKNNLDSIQIISKSGKLLIDGSYKENPF